MFTDDNKAIARRWFEEGMNGQSVALIDALFTPDVVAHLPGGPPLHGREDAQHLVEALAVVDALAGLRDARTTVEDMIAEGDKVAVRFTSTVSWQDDLTGRAAAGRVTTTAIGILRFEGDRIAELWLESDLLGLMQRLGVISVPGAAMTASP